MNKLSIFLLLFFCTLSLSAETPETNQYYLPDDILLFLDKHYKIYEIDKIKYDIDKKKYTVKYKCGFEVEMDSKGKWISIKRKAQPLPASVINLLPKKIIHYIANNYSNKPLIRMKQKSNCYKITLSNASELLFDVYGDFIKED